MKKRDVWYALLMFAVLPVLASVSASDLAARAVDRFFDASGGLEKVRSLQSLSVTAQIEAFQYQYTIHLLADGRFRVEAPDRTTVHDGQDYWQSFHGVVQKLSGDDLEQYRDVSLRGVFFHDLLDSQGKVASPEYAGTETAHGKSYELLARTTPEGNKRTYYLNSSTGLVDKMVELEPDPDLRERKNVHRFADFQDIEGLVLPTSFQAVCLTNGEDIQPLTRFSDFKLNEEPDEALFTKPESEAPPATVVDGAIVGQVVGLSGRGSLITNITSENVEELGVTDGAVLAAEVKGHETHHAYSAEIQGFTDVGPGDYLAIFNRTPTLWLVKAYVGMTSDDSTYAEGDLVRITVLTETEGEAGE